MNPSFPKIAKVVVGLPVEGPFDYLIPEVMRSSIAVGQRVSVLFNRQKRVGFVVGFAHQSKIKCLEITSILDRNATLDSQALRLTKAVSEYYGCSWGEAIETYYPRILRRAKPMDAIFNLLAPQENEIQTPINFIYDKTQEKRWPIILEHAQKTLDQEKNIIILVPEAADAQGVVNRLNVLNVAVVIFDKRLSENKELDQWIKIKANEYRIVVGTRSSIFAPLPRVGQIIMIDEENSAYKQEQSPHYHAHQVAFMRREIDYCALAFVSTAPSVEMWYKATQEKWNKIILADGRVSQTQLVDMTNYNPRKSSIISFPLQNLIADLLKRQGKIILYMNRRGMATLTRCNQCGFTVKCERCDVHMKVIDNQQMICGRCNFKMGLPKICPHCQGDYLHSMGKGIDKIASDLSKFYPQAVIRRYDKETDHYPQTADIVMATQAILRQKENIKVDSLAVINFDAELNHLDFRSAQHAFSLMAHLRLMAKEKFLIQTHMRDHYCLQASAKMDFEKFYKKELKFRKQLGLPPYKHLVVLSVRGPNEGAVIEQSQKMAAQLKEKKPARIEVSLPHPDTPVKLRDNYRYMILLKGHSVQHILKYVKVRLKHVKRIKRNIVTIVVDQ